MTESALVAPFPWYGGKRKVASKVWTRFGDTANYVEPFFGSGAVLLGRPHMPRTETVNDKDSNICNFYRALAWAPEEVTKWCDWPVNETDLHARHLWLLDQLETLTERLMADPMYFDAKIAGWWVWGQCIWIGGGWCSGKARRTSRQKPSLGNYGMGVHATQIKPPKAQRGGNVTGINATHLKVPKAERGGNSTGIHAKRPGLQKGTGVHRKRPRIDRGGRGIGAETWIRTPDCWAKGVHRKQQDLSEYMQALAIRLRRVRVCCGDFARVLTKPSTTCIGLTAVFLDPPYSTEAGRDNEIYAQEDLSVAHRAREWALEHGDDPLMRIALCGYEGEHEMPASWECLAWKGHGGTSRNNDNHLRERIWFSPHCLKVREGLFGGM